ncbi:5'-methylthioadenosine/S-adenosylhomocysteine nucleosidase family protein [Micromonospora craniellae]|uniref:Nucleoside phosphorylase domain-containing protein n=1 Tax=Micromonospora craniellae TaxID=2294034 RepID=A0A372FWK8_9ACTN|nr:hypothetical protein [Micromonospora craniellae]QOC93595.1 hypothetical protein ID554_08150 [Micromonospora craniellae]RFS45014.1 hypothetical protein D0Q02_19375 [Micromonospora craniellae]
MNLSSVSNSGIVASGGTISVGGNVSAEQHLHHGTAPGSTGSADSVRRRADVAVLTVLREEMAAVAEVLSRAPDHWVDRAYGGAAVHRATVSTPEGPLRVVATQALEPGTHSALIAFRDLCQRFAPQLVLLVGIAGAVRADVEIGDVVLADEVIWYDSRRETEDGPKRRGRIQATAPVLRRRVNDFLVRHGTLFQLEPGRSHRIHRGPVGSGNAVVTDAGSDIRGWLVEVHEKVLAVETEAGGLAQGFYEAVDGARPLRGWMTIRGISDHADRQKGHRDHELASRHAAAVLERLLPFLRLAPEES